MILITGGMGFIGLHTARSLLDAGEDVVLTRFRARREPSFIKDDLGKRAKVETLDIADTAAVLDVVRRHKVTGIVHLAVPGLGALSAAEDYRTNMVGLLNILEAARQAEVRRLTLASSIAVYSGVPAGPFREDTPLPITSGNPTEAYKKAWDILALHYADRTKMDIVMMRIAGIYGPLYHSMANLPSRLCHAAVQGVEPDLAGARGGVPFEEDEADLCYVKDCADGIRSLQMAESLPQRIYNVGSGMATSYGKLAEAVRTAVPGARITLKPGKGPQSRPSPYMDISRIAADAGYQPKYDIEQSVADYVQWLRENPQ